MKKILTIAASLAIVAGFASCQKENFGENSGNSEQATITATFADQTKVVYAQSDNDLQPKWEAEVDIIVGICGDQTFELKVKSVTNDVATLVANEGSEIPDGAVTLFYKSGLKKENWDGTNNQFVVSLNSQKGDKTMPAIMCATGTITAGSGDFKFTNAGAVLGIYEVGSEMKGETIKQVTLYGKKLASSANLASYGVSYIDPVGTYNVISTEILSGITVGTDEKGTLSSPILMAVPRDATVDSVFIRTTEGEVYSLGSTNPNAIAANNYRYIKDATFERDANRDDMILTGVFSVAADKQVFFTQGNLWADASGDKASNPVLHFENNQYSFNNSNAIEHKSYFAWFSSLGEAVSNEGTFAEFFFCDENHKVSVDGSDNIYYALSKDEWDYLLEKNQYNGFGLTIEGKKYYGLFLYPNNYDGDKVSNNSMTWDQINAAGIVFLPAAGLYNHDQQQVYQVNTIGYYCTSTPDDGDMWNMYFTGNNTMILPGTQNGGNRSFGHAIRLVTKSN